MHVIYTSTRTKKQQGRSARAFDCCDFDISRRYQCNLLLFFDTLSEIMFSTLSGTNPLCLFVCLLLVASSRREFIDIKIITTRLHFVQVFTVTFWRLSTLNG